MPLSKHKYYSLAYRILRDYGDASTVLDAYVEAKMAWQASPDYRPSRRAKRARAQWNRHMRKDMSHPNRQKYARETHVLALPPDMDLTTINK